MNEPAPGNELYFDLRGTTSSDSRIGWLVPEANITGKASITYWRD